MLFRKYVFDLVSLFSNSFADLFNHLKKRKRIKTQEENQHRIIFKKTKMGKERREERFVLDCKFD